jgi:hypothetical protein
MRPATSLLHILAMTLDEDRHRDEERRHAHDRALAEAGPAGPSVPARLRATILSLVRRDHSLTDYPCRLPDGGIGRVAVIPSGGDWTLVCRVA